MTVQYFYEKIDHRPGGNSAALLAQISRAFSAHHDRLQLVCTLAGEVAGLIAVLDKCQQDACAAVCPDCRSVCCINRHAYHEHEDIVYLAALGAGMPAYNTEIPETDPCQFLGKGGCTVSRHLRPHRCNTYFCIPMLEYLEHGPASAYRKFVRGLELVTQKREAMLAEFFNKTHSF